MPDFASACISLSSFVVFLVITLTFQSSTKPLQVVLYVRCGGAIDLHVTYHDIPISKSAPELPGRGRFPHVRVIDGEFAWSYLLTMASLFARPYFVSGIWSCEITSYQLETSLLFVASSAMRPLCKWLTVLSTAADMPMYPLEKSRFIGPGHACCTRLTGLVIMCCSRFQTARILLEIYRRPYTVSLS